MQQMPELVEDGLDFAVGQQRRAIVGGRREIAADQAQMRILRAPAQRRARSPVMRASIQAPPRLFSRGNQSA